MLQEFSPEKRLRAYLSVVKSAPVLAAKASSFV
jgi:hypothetical protein